VPDKLEKLNDVLKVVASAPKKFGAPSLSAATVRDDPVDVVSGVCTLTPGPDTDKEVLTVGENVAVPPATSLSHMAEIDEIRRLLAVSETPVSVPKLGLNRGKVRSWLFCPPMEKVDVYDTTSAMVLLLPIVTIRKPPNTTTWVAVEERIS
jgi:hypothetical protein